MKFSKKLERTMATQLLSALLGAVLVANASAMLQGHSLRKVNVDNNVGDIRMEVCGYCSKLCPIACFAGPCPEASSEMHTVMKYQKSNQCFTCDPAMSVGISANNDFAKCESPRIEIPGGDVKGKLSTSAGMDGGLPGDNDQQGSPYQKGQTIEEGPQGPAEAGDSETNAVKAMKHAKLAHEAATKAAALALESATITDSGKKKAGENSLLRMKSSEDPAITAQENSETALKKSEGSHAVWKAALNNYNKQVWILRKQQLETAAAEREMEAARELSQKARSGFAIEKQASQDAVSKMTMLSGTAGSKIEMQFSAEELAAAASAGHRRLLFASRAAKDAMGKLNSVTSKFVYPAIAARKKPAAPTFEIPTEAPEPRPPPAAKKPSSGDKVFAVEPGDVPDVQSLLSAGMRQGRTITDDDDAVEMTSLEQEVGAQKLEQQMTQNLEQRLAENPAAIEDPSLFALPALPAMPAKLPEAMA